jgi:hypothetical protein
VNRLVVRGLVLPVVLACWLFNVCDGLSAADIRADERPVVESEIKVNVRFSQLATKN